MPDINRIRPKTAKITIPIGDESITLTYDPLKINADVEAVELEYKRRGEVLSALAYCLSEWIVEWDLTEDGQPYEITMDNIVALGADVTHVLTNALLEHRATMRLAQLAAVDDRIAKVAKGAPRGQNSPKTND